MIDDDIKALREEIAAAESADLTGTVCDIAPLRRVLDECERQAAQIKVLKLALSLEAAEPTDADLAWAAGWPA